jgi:2'-5' RNA ligase
VRYLLYIELPARLARPIVALARTNPGHRPSVPHITVVGPRRIETVDREPEFVRVLRRTIRAFSPGPIAYSRVAHFGRRSYVYAVVSPAPHLACWHKACLRAVKRILTPSLYSWPRFHPHITLAAGLSEEEGNAVWRAVKARPVRGTFLCRQILLARQDGPDAPWRHVARFRLAGESSEEALSPPSPSAFPLPPRYRRRRPSGR